MHSAIYGNAETLRSQSYCPRISSALSASPRFKIRRSQGEAQFEGIIFMTVQKFSLLSEEHEYPLMCTLGNVVAFSGEAHPSQLINAGKSLKIDRRSNFDSCETHRASRVFRVRCGSSCGRISRSVETPEQRG